MEEAYLLSAQDYSRAEKVEPIFKKKQFYYSRIDNNLPSYQAKQTSYLFGEKEKGTCNQSISNSSQ